MPKEDWGVKRLCPETGRRFYDLNKTPIISPYTGNVVELNVGRSRTIIADAEDAETKKAHADDVEVDADADVLEDDDVDVDLGDDVLEDDDDDDEVSLDDIADMPADDDEI